MTEQQAFDKIWTYFVTQRHEPLIDRDGGVINLGPMGLLMDNDGSLFEVLKTGHDILSYSDVIDKLGLDSRFLHELQNCHNYAFDPSDPGGFAQRVEKMMRELAVDYGLRTPDQHDRPDAARLG